MKGRNTIITAVICAGSAFVINIIALLLLRNSGSASKTAFLLGDILFLISLLFLMALITAGLRLAQKRDIARYYEKLSLSALKCTTDGFAILDDHNHVEYASPDFLTRIRAGQCDIIGKKASDALPEKLYRILLEYRMAPESWGDEPCARTLSWGDTVLTVCIFSLADQRAPAKYMITLREYDRQPLSAPLEEPDTAALNGRGQRILVVEDTPINYEIVEELLEDAGLRCEHAASGPEALELCGKRGDGYYTVILMDIHMPGMDGYETSKKIKEMGIITPIIALTATTMNKHILKQHKDILENYILKPFKPAQLYDTLQPYIEEAPSDAADAPPKEDPFAGREKAIENLGGSKALYEKHLAKFKTNYASAADTLDERLALGNREEAKILAHSIKGLAGTLGLPYLAEASAALEAAIAEGKEDLTSEIEVFRDKLVQAVSK
ncbi:response regulator [bacterium 210820-DFI.6.37]|nr:response regulator [bacterium 210820-DFI.6.37]